MCQTVTIISYDQGGNKEYWDSDPKRTDFKVVFSALLFQMQVTFLQMQSSQQLKLLDQSMMQVVTKVINSLFISSLNVAAFSSQFQSTIFRQGSSISHWLESKGVLCKLLLDDKKKLKICIIINEKNMYKDFLIQGVVV